MISMEEEIFLEEEISLGEEIPFNYFHQLLLRNMQQMKIVLAENKIDQDEDMDIIELLFLTKFSKEEMISILNKVLLDICKDYMLSSDSALDVIPNDPFEFVSLILDTKTENPYWGSFVTSLPYIYQEYFGALEIGVPYLERSEDDKLPPCFTINLDAQYQIRNFEMTNIDTLEQDKIMNQIVSMEVKGQIGPIPKVRILKDPDATLKVIVS